MNQVYKRSLGFTLIELMLAMTFLSVLLLAIAMTIIQISNIYNRGLTLKEVNVAGRTLSTELQRSIGASAPFSVESGNTTRYISESWGGRLCLGQYSYIWNYGKTLTNNLAERNKYAAPNEGTDIRFVKVIDGSGSYCTERDKAVVLSDATELLNIGEHTLAVHGFVVTSSPSAIDTKTKQQLYSISFTIGTNDQAALYYEDGGQTPKSCKGPGDAGADLTYCAVNEFEIVARAGNDGAGAK